MPEYNYATKNSGMFEQRLTQETLTSLIETPEVDWVDAKSFKTTTITTSGYQPHTRNKGYNEGTVMNEKQIYTLEFDRDVEFSVDRADVDETAQDLAAARITNTFITENAAPEVDAYRFSKMAANAIGNNHAATNELTVANVYSELKRRILPLRKYRPSNNVVYVSSETMDLLERSTEFTRNITNQNVGNTSLESRVTDIDGVLLVEVWDIERFASGFNFSNGFTQTGHSINFLAVSRPSIIAKAKFNSVYLFQPGQHTEGDGYLYQNRLYHDLFVLKSRTDGLFVHHKGDGDNPDTGDNGEENLPEG